jgi:transposase
MPDRRPRQGAKELGGRSRAVGMPALTPVRASLRANGGLHWLCPSISPSRGWPDRYGSHEAWRQLVAAIPTHRSSLVKSCGGHYRRITDAPSHERDHRAGVTELASPGPYVVGLDLAKHVFQVHVSTPEGVCLRRDRLSRAEVLPYFEQLPASLVAMEACGGAHYWASAIRDRGHSVRLLHALTVSKIRQQQKNDKNDAAAINLAARLPDIRSVPWKSPEQQAVLALHCMRQLVMSNKLASSNQLLGLLGEFGDVGWTSLTQIVGASDEDVDLNLRQVPSAALIGLRQLLARIRYCVGQQYALELQIERWHAASKESQLVATIPRVGALTATAIVATFGGDFDAFRSGRDVAAWLGLVPTQHSSGNSVRLGHVRKSGDRYLRWILYNVGSFSTLDVYRRRLGPRFLVRMLNRGKPHKVIAIAFANKLARTAWTMLRDRHAFEVRSDWEQVPFKGKPKALTQIGKDREFGIDAM